MIRLLAALVCLLLAVFNPVAAQSLPIAADAFEVDNSKAEAKPLTFSATAQQHNFHKNGDGDWMTFTLPPGGSAVITFAPTTTQWADRWRAELREEVLGISFYRGQQIFGTMADGTTVRTLTASNSFPVTSTFYIYVFANTSAPNAHTFSGTWSKYTVRATSASGGNLPPYVTVTGPGNNSNHPLGNAINLTATASDPDGTIDHVEFLINGQEVGRSTQTPFSYPWVATATGSYTYSARAVDNGGASTTSPTQTIVVSPGAQPPTVTLDPIGGPFGFPATITLTATAYGAGGITRVDFIADGNLLESVYEWPYTHVWTNASIGPHTVTAQAFNSIYLSSTSAPQQVVVTGPNQPPTVSLSVTPAGSAFPLGQSFTLQATASDVDGVPQWVEFFANGNSLVKDYTSPYSHVWTPTLTGTYTLQARTIDDDGAPATSSSVTITITAASNQPPTVSLTAPTAGSVHTIGQTVAVQVTANDPENSLNRVELLENGAIVQTISGAGPYNFAWIPANVGARVLQARAVDNGSPQLSTLSDSVSVTVTANAPSNCSFDGWSTVVGTPLAGEPDDAIAIPRYRGRCGIQADAIGDYLADTSPADEDSYNARFYYFTGDRIGGAADIFQARSTAGIVIRVQHDGNSLIFGTAGTATTRSVVVADNRWYMIRLTWISGAGNGSLGIHVLGNGSATTLDPPSITGLNNQNERIEEARLGLISGAGTGAVGFDEFEARRYTAPSRLCRGDANDDGRVSSADRTYINNEILSGGQPSSPGQPDANEDGAITSADVDEVTQILLGGQTCEQL